MAITIESKESRACPVCHERLVKAGFNIKNSKGHSSFQCEKHTVDLLRQDLEESNDSSRKAS